LRILKYVKSKKTDYMEEDSSIFIHKNKIYTIIQQNDDIFVIIDESGDIHEFEFNSNLTYEWFDLFYGDLES